MRKLFLICLLLLIGYSVQSQNRFFLQLEASAVTTLKIGPQAYFQPEQHYFGLIEDFSIHKKIYPYFSLGFVYETPSFSILKQKYYLMTNLNIKYEDNKNFYFNGLLITNEFFLPKKVKIKVKKFRVYLGIRNSFVIVDFDRNTPNYREVFPINRHRYGGLILLNYQLSKKIELGLNIYHDFNDIARVFSGAEFKTIETNLRIAYQIK